MRQLGIIVLFAMCIVFGFAGYTTWGLPLIIPEAPPVEEKLGGDMTMDQYIAVGKKIFHGKGTCTLCHNNVGHRAPLLDVPNDSDGPPVAVRAAERLKDPNYKGKATTALEYIHESMVEPSAFVVPGFGKKGTNDTVSPMPTISKGAIGLNDGEIYAVIAFLQSIAGVDVTVSLPTGGEEMATGEDEDAKPAKVAENATEAFLKFECATCHEHPLIEEGGDIGPNLGELPKVAGKRKKGMAAREYIKESIMNPNAFIVEDFDEDTMPDDFSKRMTVAEFDMIVDALLGKKE